MKLKIRQTVLVATAAFSVVVLGGCAAVAESEPTTGSDTTSSSETTSAVDATGSQLDLAVGIVGEDRNDDIAQYCGTEELTVALADGFGGNAWRAISRAEFEDEAAKCSNITEVLYTDAQGDPAKAVSDIQGLVAQGVDVIVTFADSGEALLPAIQQATAAGTVVIPYVSPVGGEAGKDYSVFVAPDLVNDGKMWAQWMAEQLDGEGRVVFLGGTAGNGEDPLETQGILEVWKDYPGMELIGGQSVVTGWDISKAQKAMAGLLAQNSQIDGIISNYGNGSTGAMQAFVQANRPLVPWAALDGMLYACTWQGLYASNPNFEMFSTTSRNWLSRNALRKGLAVVNGLDNTEPSTVNMYPTEDSTDPDMQPVCDPSLPSEAIISSRLTVEQQLDVLN